MTFADKSRYDRTFQQVTHRGGEISINYIKRFQNAQVFSVSVGNIYSEDQIMHTFLDNFQQSGKYSSQLASHQTELRREEKYPDQKCLNISSLQTEYLNLDSSLSGSSKHNEKANSSKAKCTHCGLSNHSVEKCFKNIRKEKRKLVLLVLRQTKIQTVQLRNALYADLNIILSQNVPNHLKTVRKDASLKNLSKKVIVHATTAMMMMKLKYTHLWHKCLVTTNAKIKIMAIVCD